ncbi:GNAT family N-acetyltransferase [Alteribacter keqinensis]|uniref:GNAT family N-acetyltransferase n=1 Tax=Alteribacter keqinensis TaxID=2483800 RepID=A0A3M7TN25_9BACI|nr:GNAT family N-acetyltransferase [Alteribacter keqinensis]RNA67011.1 GNAT family N-acetyltransferase [Alteribacter keqinensis]
MIKIRVLSLNDLTLTMLDSFDRTQHTSRVLTYEKGEWQEKTDYFEDAWSPEEKRTITDHFYKTIESGGTVITAEDGPHIAGFAVLEPGLFGKTAVYQELSYLHSDRRKRGQGIGRQLFHKAKEEARASGAEKLYIGAHPAVETQHFYRSMGCVPAKETNEEIYLREVRDIQLETDL